MKKTLFALLALGSLAMGEDVALGLTLNGITNNSGWGYLDPNDAILSMLNRPQGAYADGGYMFNDGGKIDTDTDTHEGILWDDSANGNGICLSLCSRSGAGYAGEVILDSATELIGKEVGGFTFNVTSSAQNGMSGDVTLTLALLHHNGTTWTKVQENTGTLTLGSGSSVALDLTTPVETWGTDYKVAAMVMGTDTLSGPNAWTPYTLQGISLTANDVVGVPEPTTATLSLLALAGLAARRRRK